MNRRFFLAKKTVIARGGTNLVTIRQILDVRQTKKKTMYRPIILFSQAF